MKNADISILCQNVDEVLGSELKVGDLIWNHGYLWVIDRCLHEPSWQSIADEKAGKVPPGRWCFTTHWAGIGSNPNFFNDDFGTALRDELKWSRVRADVAKTFKLRNKGE